MENAVVYARYSSHNQTEQSIEGQLSAARKYAEVKGYTIIKEYCDRAKTGTNDNREAFQEMLHDCQSHSFTVIIVWKVDRFGRNREEITFNKYRAKKHGVRVEYIAENITEGPEGVILESVLEGMAEYYSLQLSQNVKRGLLETAKKHKVLGGHMPLGYKKGKNNEYAIDEDTARTIRLIFDMYESGYTMVNIIEYLNKNGYTNRRGTKFSKNSLPSILSNERYKGTYIYKDIIKEEDAIPAIVSKEQFERVQIMKELNRRMPSHCWNYSDYLLTEKLFCGECNSPMIGKSGYGKMGVKYNYYTCLGHVKKICEKKSIRQEELENIVISEVMSILSDPDTFNYMVDLIWNHHLETDRVGQEIKKIQKNIARVNSAIDNLVRSVEQGMPYEIVKSRMEELNSEKVLYSKLLAEKNIERSTKLTKENITEFLTKFTTLDYTDKSCQKVLISNIINKIYLYSDRVVIAMNYTDENQVRLCAINQGVTNNKRTLLLIQGLPVIVVPMYDINLE